MFVNMFGERLFDHVDLDPGQLFPLRPGEEDRVLRLQLGLPDYIERGRLRIECVRRIDCRLRRVSRSDAAPAGPH